MADANIKIYSNETIQDNPLPQQQEESMSVSQQTSNSTFGNQTIKDQKPPMGVVARELINKAFNTVTRKIEDTFEFTKMGAIKIGEYVSGVSGEIKISPNGITAKNKDGIQTVAIDGETGDAFFRGTIQANDFVIADEFGLSSIGNFESDFYADDSGISTTSGSAVDVAGSSLSFTLERETNVFISFYALVGTFGTLANTTYRTDVFVAIDGVGQSPFAGAGWYSATAQTFIKYDTVSGGRIYTLPPGEHTIKLQWRTTSADGSEMYTRNINYVILGR